MAHKQGTGFIKNNRDSLAKHFGLKVTNNQHIKNGEILVTQKGLSFKAGLNVGIAKNYTLYALSDGFILIKGKTLEIHNFINLLQLS